MSILQSLHWDPLTRECYLLNVPFEEYYYGKRKNSPILQPSLHFMKENMMTLLYSSSFILFIAVEVRLFMFKKGKERIEKMMSLGVGMDRRRGRGEKKKKKKKKKEVKERKKNKSKNEIYNYKCKSLPNNDIYFLISVSWKEENYEEKE